MTPQTPKQPNRNSEKTVQQSETRDKLPEKQMQTREESAYSKIALNIRRTQEAQQQ
jgi:hypothetical protein